MKAISRRQTWWLVLVLIALVLIGVRIALPGWVADSVNRQLADMGEYHGEIGGVALHLWRGAYSIENLHIEKRTGKVPVPLIDAPRTDLTVSWPALLHGAVVARVTLESPEINFVDANGDAEAQSGKGVNWRSQLEDLLPIRLDEVLIHNGTVHFRNFSTNPKVDVVATSVEARVQNLSNARNEAERAADLDCTATVLGDAAMQSTAQFDPLGKLDDFKFSLKIDRLQLQRLNDLLQAYVKVDVESGEGELLMELEARDGQLRGYAKPLFRDVQVFSWKHDVEEQGDNPLRAAWEAVAGALENLFKNQPKDQFATRIEIKGRIGDTKTSTLQAIGAILHNAFVEAYRPQFEHLQERRDDKKA